MEEMRVIGLDTLRGIAIMLMIIDHVAAIIYFQPINENTIRFLTRLSEPIFVILFGYFLYGRKKENKFLTRALQILAAAIFVNIFYFLIIGKAEILLSILLVYTIFMIFDKAVLLFPLFALLSFNDITVKFLDYPLSIVFMQACIGYLIRSKSNLSFFAITIFLLTSLLWPSPYFYTIIFTIPAILLLIIFEKHFNKLKIEPLTTFGKYPLSSYISQYIIIVLLALYLNPDLALLLSLKI